MSDEKKPIVRPTTDHPWVAIDLDGTLMEDHQYPGFGLPRPGARDAVLYLQSLGLKIMVFTTRTHVSGLDGKFQNVNKIVNDIHAWGKEHNIPIDYVWPYLKPAAVICFFDDRAISVRPPSPHDPLDDFEWSEAIEEFNERYAATIPNWLREVTPKSFEVEQP
jgi:hypothetical protein